MIYVSKILDMQHLYCKLKFYRGLKHRKAMYMYMYVLIYPLVLGSNFQFQYGSLIDKTYIKHIIFSKAYNCEDMLNNILFKVSTTNKAQILPFHADGQL